MNACFDIEVTFDIVLLRCSTLRYSSTKLRYPYMNSSLDIEVEVIFRVDIGLLRYRKYFDIVVLVQNFDIRI
jgi:hypothetical protein